MVHVTVSGQIADPPRQGVTGSRNVNGCVWVGDKGAGS